MSLHRRRVLRRRRPLRSRQDHQQEWRSGRATFHRHHEAGFAGVDYLHRHLRIAHRDLSLENVLVHNGVCKISDFGLSVDANARCCGRVGKAYYMAPEVVAGETYDPVKADVWSLGILWFILLTGSPLVPIASTKATSFLALRRCGVASVFKSWGFEKKVSPAVIGLVSRMLTVDPKERISLDELVAQPFLAA